MKMQKKMLWKILRQYQVDKEIVMTRIFNPL